MYQDQKIYLGKSEEEKIFINPQMANRHGMIAGATGTGKTVTLKVLAEAFSDCGVPVFLADVKGDLAGMCQPGTETEDMAQRLEIAFLLKQGTKYQDVADRTGVSSATISRVNRCLQYGAGGYQTITERLGFGEESE